MRPSCVSGLRQVGRGFRFFPVILFMVRSLSVRLAGLLAPAYLCTDWQPETVVMVDRAGLRRSGTGSRKGRVPLGIRTEETAKNNGATMGREVVMIVLVFTIKAARRTFITGKAQSVTFTRKSLEKRASFADASSHLIL